MAAALLGDRQRLLGEREAVAVIATEQVRGLAAVAQQPRARLGVARPCDDRVEPGQRRRAVALQRLEVRPRDGRPRLAGRVAALRVRRARLVQQRDRDLARQELLAHVGHLLERCRVGLEVAAGEHLGVLERVLRRRPLRQERERVRHVDLGERAVARGIERARVAQPLAVGLERVLRPADLDLQIAELAPEIGQAAPVEPLARCIDRRVDLPGRLGLPAQRAQHPRALYRGARRAGRVEPRQLGLQGLAARRDIANRGWRDTAGKQRHDKQTISGVRHVT